MVHHHGRQAGLSGRDARTNDQVVKKHLKTTDRYATPIFMGPPAWSSRKAKSATDEDMEEVCAFALAHSRPGRRGARELHTGSS